MGVDLTEQADAPEGDLEDEDLIEGELPEDDDPAEDDQDDAPEGDEDQIEVKFGDEAAPASNEERDTGLVRKLRAEIRERDARLAAVERGTQPEAIVVGDKPTIEGCDYDDEKFEAEFEAWKDRKAKADEANAATVQRMQAQNAAWAEELAEHGRKRAALRAPDYEAAAEEVGSVLSQMQQVVVIKAADDSAKVFYALGKHPQKLATLAAIEDPIKLAVAVSKLEGTIAVTRRKAPEPEERVRGSAPLAAGGDKKLERLEKEAQRTGNRTEVIRYRQQLKAKAKP